MNHAVIEEREIVERYVTGKLSAEERVAFEEHYLGCADCIEQVEDAERLHRGLRRVAEEETRKAVRTGIFASAAAWARQRSAMLGLALLLVVASLPALWQQGRIADLRASLEATRGERDVLTARWQAMREPSAATRIFSLSPFRDAGLGETPRHVIDLPPEEGWIVLELDPGGIEASRRRATLRRDGKALWHSSALELDELGMVAVSIHSSFLTAGEYELELNSIEDEPITLARYPLWLRLSR